MKIIIRPGPGLLEKDDNLFNVINNSFKFFDSGFVPNKEKYVYTGAEIGVDGDVPIHFNCHGGTKSKKAEAVAKINEEGKISEIILLNKGAGYKKASVDISGGGGRGGKAKAIVDDNSTISHIEIISGGSNYVSTPHVKISSPVQNKTCKLFFKKNK